VNYTSDCNWKDYMCGQRTESCITDQGADEDTCKTCEYYAHKVEDVKEVESVESI
jgi:hypothetical protein